MGGGGGEGTGKADAYLRGYLFLFSQIVARWSTKFKSPAVLCASWHKTTRTNTNVPPII